MDFSSYPDDEVVPVRAGTLRFRALAEVLPNAWFSGAVFVFFLSTWAGALVIGVSFIPFLTEYGERLVRSLVLIASIATVGLALKALFDAGPRSVTETLIVTARSAAGSRFLIRYVSASLLLTVFMAAFLFNKMQIPRIAGFRWDEAFAALDYRLFGEHPWVLLQPLLGYPIVTAILDVLYAAWALLVFLFWGGLFASRRIDDAVCYHFWIATVACWILLGLGMAMALGSAGPTYFDEIAPQLVSPYQELERYLAAASRHYTLMSSFTKDYLWAIHSGELVAPGGISAMPSMHNAQATLYAAAAYSINRRFGHVMFAYAVAIFLGSIHLGWHYAVDGIIGALGALLIWLAVGALIRRRGRGSARAA